MLKHRATIRNRALVATILAAALLGSCAQTKDFMAGFRKSPAVEGEAGILGAPAAEDYLQELEALAAGDPATQAEIYADAQAGSTLTPGPQTNLRYALVLATPGHPETDPDKAQSMLRELLAQTELLTRAETALATIHLRHVENVIVLNSESRQLRASTSRAARTQQAAADERLATVEAENRRLEQALEEAEEKLEAITSIERSIREQENP
jgi:hypothetical protein